MLTNSPRALLLIMAAASCFRSDFALEARGADPKTGNDDEPAPATVKVEKGPLTASVTATGTLVGENTTEIRVRLKSWPGPLIVEQAAEQGALVKKGTPLLTFEADKIEKLVHEAREEQASSALAIRLAEHELPIFKQRIPLDLAASEKAKDQAGEDLVRFLQLEKSSQMKAAEFQLRSAEFQVESSREELEQLKKMYADKDLTEETEQMILKRYKFQLEAAEQYLDRARLQTETTLKVELPRQEEAVKLAAEKAALDWEKAREGLPLELRQQELALEKLKHDDGRAADKLSDLEHDLSQMTVAAPADGMVYYGRYADGKWSGPPAAEFLEGGTLPANDFVMTIVSQGKLFLHVDVEEKQAGEIQVGQTVRIAPTISPREKLNGKVDRVSPVPQDGKFEVMIAVTGDVPERMAAGMTGSAKIITGKRDAALSIPSSAVFEDPDGETWYVYKPGDNPQKVVVKTGLIAGDKTEILEGLEEGDEILEKKP
jgi:multidrug efflux pump subunit AcrA (membrane-fusion protein)